MMKKMNKTLALLLCLLLALTLAGCKKAEVDPNQAVVSQLMGVWTMTDMNGTDAAVEEMEYYRANGAKLQMAFGRDTIEILNVVGTTTDYDAVSYKVEGDQLILDYTQLTFTLDGDTLTLTTQGVNMVFTRSN